MNATYKQAGVDIAAGDSFAERIVELAKRYNLKTDIGGFAGGFPLPPNTPICYGSVDGPGTKLNLHLMVGTEMIGGIDAGAMAGVDLYVAGCRIIAIFDYLPLQRLEIERHLKIVEGLMRACQLMGCGYLPGGETAEHPRTGVPDGHADIGVFAVGVPDPALSSNPQKDIMPGMEVWGCLSYGLGANGYSLARMVLKLIEGFWGRVLRAIFGGEYGRFTRIRSRLCRYYPELGSVLHEALLRPTCIYIRDIERLRRQGVNFPGLAHITGGGMPGNIPRILPENCVATIQRGTWVIPPIFGLIQRKGKVAQEDMDRTFNMGIQLVFVVPRGTRIDHPDFVRIGYIRERKGDEPQVEFVD